MKSWGDRLLEIVLEFVSNRLGRRRLEKAESKFLSYYDVLCSYHIDVDPAEGWEREKKFRAWQEKVEPLSSGCQEIYRSLMQDLDLHYDPRELVWWYIKDKHGDTLLGRIQEIIEKIKQLKARK